MKAVDHRTEAAKRLYRNSEELSRDVSEDVLAAMELRDVPSVYKLSQMARCNADYLRGSVSNKRSWSLPKLQAIADALDCELRVQLIPFEEL